MAMSSIYQGRALLVHYLKLEFSQPERLLSALLFSVTFLLVFMFAMGKVEPTNVPNLFVSEAFLAGFFALQLSFSRSLEPDSQDSVFSLLRSYPISPVAWYVAKYFLVLITGSLVLMPTIFFAAFFHTEARVPLLNAEVFVVAFMSLLGLVAVGVLLGTLTLGSGTRQVLYPLLYFPLTTPVLLASVESSRSILVDGASIDTMLQSWLGLLLVFDIIYCTLGVLLFGELVKAE